MRSAENDFCSGRPDGVRHFICPRSHTRHRADSHEANVVFSHKTCDLRFCHRLGISIDQKYAVLNRRKGFQQEHPKMGHEIPGNTVVGTVKKNVHRSSSFGVLEGRL
jgi:hypothetical protein